MRLKIFTLQIVMVILSNLLFADEYKIPFSNPALGDSFGYAVAIDGDYAIVGSPSKDSSGLGNDIGKAYIYIRSGTDWNLQDSLSASDAAAGDKFGWRVDVDGEYAVVGAPYRDSTITFLREDVGKVYIYKRDGTNWSEQARLIPSGSGQDLDESQFGRSVSIDGNYVIIGARGDNNIATESGAAYIFHRDNDTWTEQNKLVYTSSNPLERFGQSVSISGDYALIGAYYNDENGRNAGAAYIYLRNVDTWEVQDTLLASDGDSLDFFGSSVSIYGDYAVIGAPATASDPQTPGHAYVYNRSGTVWNQQDRLIASDSTNRDFFGYSVSIYGDFIVIGAPRADDWPATGFETGAIYSFLRSGSNWYEKEINMSSDAATDDYFGWSVDISSDYAIVGVPYKDSTGIGNSVGAAYVYNNFSDLSLPVELIAFNYVANLNSILLKWTTASEIENQGFILCRATDEDFNFITIASYLNNRSLVGAGNSSYQNEYSYEDNSIDPNKTYIYKLYSVSVNGEIDEIGQVKLNLSEKNYPDNIVLYSNYPNPFNPVTNFRIFVPENTNDFKNFELMIYNSIGQKVKTVYAGNISEGYHSFKWNGISDNGTIVSSGIYYAILNYGKNNQIIKMSLIK